MLDVYMRSVNVVKKERLMSQILNIHFYNKLVIGLALNYV